MVGAVVDIPEVCILLYVLSDASYFSSPIERVDPNTYLWGAVHHVPTQWVLEPFPGFLNFQPMRQNIVPLGGGVCVYFLISVRKGRFRYVWLVGGARRRHDADIQRGERRQQREVRHCNRGAATHDPGQEGRRPGEPNTLTMQRHFAYATVDLMEAQYRSIVRAREWQLARTPMPNMTRGEVWYLICPGLMMPVVRVRIVAVGVYTPQCSCHPHGVCYTHGEWQPVVHIDGDLPGEHVLVSQRGTLLPTDRLAQLIAAASRGAKEFNTTPRHADPTE